MRLVTNMVWTDWVEHPVTTLLGTPTPTVAFGAIADDGTFSATVSMFLSVAPRSPADSTPPRINCVAMSSATASDGCAWSERVREVPNARFRPTPGWR